MNNIINYIQKNIDIFLISLFIIFIIFIRILTNNINSIDTQDNSKKIQENLLLNQKFKKLCLSNNEISICSDLNNEYNIEQIITKNNTIYFIINNID